MQLSKPLAYSLLLSTILIQGVFAYGKPSTCVDDGFSNAEVITLNKDHSDSQMYLFHNRSTQTATLYHPDSKRYLGKPWIKKVKPNSWIGLAVNKQNFELKSV